MRTRNRFARGSGRFTCGSCGKQTRDTGENASVRLCPVCKSRAECGNALSDAGYAGNAWGIFESCETVAQCEMLLDAELHRLNGGRAS